MSFGDLSFTDSEGDAAEGGGPDAPDGTDEEVSRLAGAASPPTREAQDPPPATADDAGDGGGGRPTTPTDMEVRPNKASTTPTSHLTESVEPSSDSTSSSSSDSSTSSSSDGSSSSEEESPSPSTSTASGHGGGDLPTPRADEDGADTDGEDDAYAARDQWITRKETRICLDPAPRSLVLHLKRFEYDPRGGRVARLPGRVDVPETLDLGGAGAPGGPGPLVYALTGAIVHVEPGADGGGGPSPAPAFGDEFEGHYVAVVRPPAAGAGGGRAAPLWTELDDGAVRAPPRGSGSGTPSSAPDCICGCEVACRGREGGERRYATLLVYTRCLPRRGGELYSHTGSYSISRDLSIKKNARNS